MDLPTMIFDEIDTGISGEPAKQVGILLQELGANRQVLCITHQPQIAAKGHSHLYVYKEQKGKHNQYAFENPFTRRTRAAYCTHDWWRPSI